MILPSWNKETGVMYLSLMDLEHCGFDVDEIPAMLTMQGYSDDEIEEMKYPRIIIADLCVLHAEIKEWENPESLKTRLDACEALLLEVVEKTFYSYRNYKREKKKVYMAGREYGGQITIKSIARYLVENGLAEYVDGNKCLISLKERKE